MTSWGLSHWETYDNPPTSKTTNVDNKWVFLAKEWNSFHIYEKKLDYIHLKAFLKYECELYLKQPLSPAQHNINVAFHTLSHRLAIETGGWMIIPISRDTRLYHVCSYNAVESEAHVMLECPLQSPTLGAHTYRRPCPWVLGGHGCDIVHGWAWVSYYNGWAWVRLYCSWIAWAKAKHIGRGH